MGGVYVCCVLGFRMSLPCVALCVVWLHGLHLCFWDLVGPSLRYTLCVSQFLPFTNCVGAGHCLCVCVCVCHVFVFVLVFDVVCV